MKTESLIHKAHRLHSPSPTIVKLLNLISVPEVDFSEVITLIERDSGLRTRLLGRCNTARYALAQPLVSVEQCVVHLGYAEVHQLILAIAFGQQFDGELPGYAMAAGALWQHSLATAQLAARIFSLTHHSEADVSLAYTAGLIHDLGKLVITQLLDGSTQNHRPALMEKPGRNLLAAEVAALGGDHAQIGAELLATWRLPDNLVTAVRYHHEPGQSGNSELAAAVHLANTVAHQVEAAPGCSSLAFTFDPAVLTTLHLKVDDLEKLASQACALAAGLKPDNSVSESLAAPGLTTLNL